MSRRRIVKHAHRKDTEEQVFTVEGFLVGYKIEPDSDYHVVIRNEAGETMIVEFPHPDCMLDSRVLKQATAARAKFRGFLRTPPTSRYIRVRKPIRLRVTGEPRQILLTFLGKLD